jgi:hypothetical protein
MICGAILGGTQDKLPKANKKWAIDDRRVTITPQSSLPKYSSKTICFLLASRLTHPNPPLPLGRGIKGEGGS